ncbi:MAG: EAL domain-containing protein [Gallionella sp.]|nr:EAL domain-containing protein [Gallionella sp.]
MKKIFNEFLQKFTFERQLGITVTLGILFLALSSSLVGSWQSNERVRANLIEQGQRITENLAHQSALALIYASADNAAEAVNATMAFPGVVSVEIRDVNQRTLLTRGSAGHAEFPAVAGRANWVQAAAVLDAESRNAWRFAAPVYTQPAAESPFNVQTATPELLGHVSVVMSKASMTQTTTDIFVANLATSFSFALLFLFLIRFLTNRMTRPLNQLSANMGRAKAGETEVRAVLTGPKDIADMAHAFNSMMVALEEREAALRVAAIAFEIEEGMIVTDSDEVIIRVNRVFTKLTGYSAEETIGKNLSMLKSDRQDAEFYPRLRETLHRDNYWQGEIWNQRKNGEIYPEWLTITAVVGKDGKITNYICAFFDITERKQAEDKIHNLAYYDPLSQLPNRRLLFDRLHQAVTTSARNQTCAGLLFIDLDNFKILNDTRGHDIGDLLLIEVGERLRTCIRESDTLARLGGDEFVVLLEGLSEDRTQAAVQARGVGEKMLMAINQPYVLKDIEHYSSASIGISLFASDRQNLDDLLKQADTAMYAAKKSGRNTLRFFDPAMQEALEIHSQLEAGLRKALPKDEFRLYYQVQVDSNQRFIGAEALIRWEHPEQGLISPAKFIPVAEETGLILPVGLWVLQTACAQLKEWESNPLARELSLAVNVSARQFRQPGFVKQISELIEQTLINPSLLKLELTESTVLENVADTIDKMHALKLIGVRFSMDDFGTGYSSLAYLTQLPLDQLKIDQSFVRNIGTKSADSMIVQTIIGMAHNLGIEVIAEGVETQAQRDFLLGAGCRFYQGYLFGRPVLVEEFTALLTYPERMGVSDQIGHATGSFNIGHITGRFKRK